MPEAAVQLPLLDEDFSTAHGAGHNSGDNVTSGLDRLIEIHRENSLRGARDLDFLIVDQGPVFFGN